MKVLVCIDNNLRYDTRVKRHVSAIAEKADEVHVLAAPNPDEHFHLDLPNVTHSFVRVVPGKYPVSPGLLEKLKPLNMTDEVLSFASFLLSDTYYVSEETTRLLELQKRLFSSGRWADLRAATPLELPDNKQIATWFWPVMHWIDWAVEAVLIPADVVYCNDISTLLCGVAHKKEYGSRLIYDIHDVPYDLSVNNKTRAQRYATAMAENELIPHADAVVSIGRLMLAEVQKLHNVTAPMVFIPNCTVEKCDERIEFTPKKRAKPVRFYYHGIAHPVRGLETVIEALQQVEGAVLNLRCLPSEYLDTLVELTEQKGLSDRVFFLDAVGAADIPRVTAEDADVGFAFWDDHGKERMSLGVRTCLNNKFIEYLKAGVPVLTMKDTEQGNIAEEYDCGFVGKLCVEDLVALMRKMCAMSPKDYTRMSGNALRASRELFDWELYKEPLQRAVLGTDASAGPREIQLERRWLAQEKRVWQQLYFNMYQRRLAIQQRGVSNHYLLNPENYTEEARAKLLQDNAALKERYAELKQSTSWRITKPLRCFVDLFRRTDKNTTPKGAQP